MRLENARALVTGGTRGIGRAIVERLAAEGARVVYCGRSDPGRDRSAGTFRAADLADSAAVNELVGFAHRELGGLDILVNNAGIELEKTLADTDEAEWDRLMDINLKAVYLACRRAIGLMTGGGSIVNLGSISAFVSDPSLAAYNISKAAVMALTRSVAVDHGPAGIRCNAVCPGWIDTRMLDQTFSVAGDVQAARAHAVSRHPARRLGRAADIAAAVAWLCTDDAGFVNGQSITVDGGLTAMSPIDPHLF